MSELSHVDASGTARMVDVGAKPETERMARATGTIRMQSGYVSARSNGQSRKLITHRLGD